MNKNLNNYSVHRTKESTIVELACGGILLLSFVLGIVLTSRHSPVGGPMVLQTIICASSVLLTLVLAYAPHTFNIPDDSPAELYALTVSLLRIAALLMALMSLGVTLSVMFNAGPVPIIVAFTIAFIPLIVWYAVKKHRITKAKQESNADYRE